MPADTNASDFTTRNRDVVRRDDSLPAGSGLALAILVGSLIWGGLLALFLI